MGFAFATRAVYGIGHTSPYSLSLALFAEASFVREGLAKFQLHNGHRGVQTFH